MSGGVDSAVAAMLAIRAGFDCTGAMMKLTSEACNIIKDDITAAGAVAQQLDIPFDIYDLSRQFADFVIEPFIAEYKRGRTPNPCVVCNKMLKFGKLLETAHESGFDYIVTGHYARVERNDTGRYILKKGIDASKDQSYVLYTLTQEQLAHVMFPLGGKTKQEVRELALSVGFDNAFRQESQDICFIPDGDYFKFITEYTGTEPARGRFIDTDGNNLGESKGVSAYTVGQRRGLGLSMPHPPYVLELRPQDNTVVVGKEEMLYTKTLKAKNINLIPFDTLEAPKRANVKIRYAHPGQPATVAQPDSDTLIIEFDEPQRAITGGQAAVIYDGDIVIGGGTIV